MMTIFINKKDRGGGDGGYKFPSFSDLCSVHCYLSLYIYQAHGESKSSIFCHLAWEREGKIWWESSHGDLINKLNQFLYLEDILFYIGIYKVLYMTNIQALTQGYNNTNYSIFWSVLYYLILHFFVL